MRRPILIAVAAVLVAGGVYLLREETISRHSPAPPGSTTEIVIESATNRRGSRATLEEKTLALVLACRLEVYADFAEPPLERLGDRRFSFVLEPALDESDRRQLQGCLEDAVIDHLQVGVRRITHHGLSS